VFYCFIQLDDAMPSANPPLENNYAHSDNRSSISKPMPSSSHSSKHNTHSHIFTFIILGIFIMINRYYHILILIYYQMKNNINLNHLFNMKSILIDLNLHLHYLLYAVIQLFIFICR
jgi:hypothetical protein